MTENMNHAVRFPLRRLENWPIRLGRYLDIAGRRSFDWADHNCCTFATSGVAVITGFDPLSLFDEPFDNHRTAVDALKAFAGGGVLETADKIAAAVKAPAIRVLQATRGDVMYLNSDGVGALGLVDLDPRNACFLTRADGLVRVPITDCAAAWKVGQ